MSRDKFRFLLVILLIGAALYSAREYSLRTDRKERAEDFVRRYIRLVQSNDLQTAYYQLTSQRFRTLVPFEKFATDYGMAFRKLGELRSYKTIAWLEPGIGRDYFQIDTDTRFQNDTGKMRFVLDMENNKFKLSGFLVYGDNWDKLRERSEE